MRRGIQSTLVILVIISLPLFWIFRAPDALPARFAPSDCARIAVADTATGRPLVGIEDMALLPDGETLLLSSAHHLALERHPSRAPEGGIYAASLPRLAAGEAWASPIVAEGTAAGGLFPHGIAVSEDGSRLAFVNRNREGTTAVIEGLLSRTGFTARFTRSDPALCRANDLVYGDGGLRVTLDRGDCGIAWADLRPGSTTGRVVALDPAGTGPPRVEVSGLAFANGIAGLWVAETRAFRLHHRLDRPMELPGGPDNLTYDPLGGLIVAVHPSIPRLAAYRHGWRDNAPSRLVRVDLDRTIEVLFDDPSGALFSGASVGVLAEGVLIVGSVLDAGLLVCRKTPA